MSSQTDATGFIQQFISSSGQPLGVILNGYTFIPYSQGGIVMQDATGALWLLTIGVDGRLNTNPVVFS